MILTSGLALTMLMGTPLSVMAKTVSTSPSTTPVNMTVEATPMDVTVSDAITMTAGADTNVATVSDLIVTNNSTAGVINVNNMNVTAKSSWTKVADTTDFAKLPMNAKQFSLVYKTHDLNADYATVQSVNPTEILTMKLSGKTGAVTTAVDAVNVADVILTLAYK